MKIIFKSEVERNLFLTTNCPSHMIPTYKDFKGDMCTKDNCIECFDQSGCKLIIGDINIINKESED